MKKVDLILQDWRINKAKKHIKPGASVLDIGSVDGILFKKLGDRISEGVGIDPLADESLSTGKYKLYKGYFPQVLPPNKTFDAITMLAVLEHIPTNQQKELARQCANHLNKDGVLIITVPSKYVDYILNLLKFLKLIDGMSLEEHYGFKPGDTPNIFSSDNFSLVKHENFQLGLNNLFVFKKK